MDTVTTGTALAVPNATGIVAMFANSDAVKSVIARIEQEARDRAKAADISTDKGRKAIASLAYDVAKTKTAMDEAGKKLNEEARAHINAVDAERRVIRERLDALKEEVRAPLTKWEADESARVAALKSRLDRLMRAQDTLADNPDADKIEALLSRVQDVALDGSWGDFLADAAKAKDATLSTLRLWLATAKQREAEAAELARLRQEAADRAEADRLRAEALLAEGARLAAEKAEAERQSRIEAEAQARVAAAAAEAEARAQAEILRMAQDAAAREAALQRQIAEAAEREAAAKRQAEHEAAEREAVHVQQMADARAAQDRAAQQERDRIAAQRVAEETARAKREADTQHRAKIFQDIADALRTMAGAASPEQIADALMNGKIPHVRVVL